MSAHTLPDELGYALRAIRAARTHYGQARHLYGASAAYRERLDRRLVELADVEEWLCADLSLAIDAEAERRKAGAANQYRGQS